MDKIYRISYFIKRLNGGDSINKSSEMDRFYVNKKTIERDMLRVVELMRELYSKRVIWDRKKKEYIIDK